MVINLRGRGPEPDRAQHTLAGRDPQRVAAGHGHADERDVEVLASGGEKDRLVRDAEQRDEDEARHQQCRRDFGGHQRPNNEQEVRSVEPDVEPGAADATEDGQAREERQLGGAGAKEVEEAAERRRDPR